MGEDHTEQWVKNTTQRLQSLISQAKVPQAASTNIGQSCRDWAWDPGPKNSFVSSEEAEKSATFHRDMSRKYNPATMPTMSSALCKGLTAFSDIVLHF